MIKLELLTAFYELAEKKPLGNSWTYSNYEELIQRFGELVVHEFGIELTDEITTKISQGKAFDLIKHLI